MTSRPLRIGLSSCMMHPDPLRNIFKGKRLLYLEESMGHYVMSRGALAFLMPTETAGVSIDDMVGALDGVVITGGVDMAPASYGETPLKPEWAGDKVRDDYELKVIRSALKQDKPLLGICRGLQVMNVAFGGTLFQDITTQNPQALVHRDWEIYDGNFHAVTLDARSALGRLYGGATEGRINSVHHQAIKDLGKGLVVEARCADDGIIEAIRALDAAGTGAYLAGVQWHPEFQDPTDRSLLAPAPILDDFLGAARKKQR